MNLAYLAYYFVLETHKPGSLETKLQFLDEEKDIPFAVIQEKEECTETVQKPPDKGVYDTIFFLYHHKRKKSCTQHYQFKRINSVSYIL